MEFKIFISPSQDIPIESLYSIRNICIKNNAKPFIRRLDPYPEEPRRGKLIERRMDPLLSSDLLIAFLSEESDREVDLDLFTANREHIPIFLVFKTSLDPKTIVAKVPNARKHFKFEKLDDALTKLDNLLSRWKNAEE